MRYRKILLRLTTIAAACAASGAFAQARAPTPLDAIVVTATRTPSTVDAALAAVEVIDRAQIDASGAHSLPELLRGRAGITIVNQGGAGKLSTLSLRGTESDHTLYLIDGVRIGSTTSGFAALQDIPLDQIERIEIVRGPRSSLYGADAIGGVIQISTRRDARRGVHAHARIAAGSHGLREASAGLDLRGARGGIGVDLAHQSTDGINACRGYFDPLTFAGAGCFIVPGTHLDRDGYRNDSATLRADYSPNARWRFDARAFRASGHNDYDGDYTDNSRILQQVLGGHVRWTPSSRLQLALGIGRSTDDAEDFLARTFISRIHTTRSSANLQGDFTLAAGQTLSAGVDWLRDRARVRDLWSPFAARRHNRAGFIMYQGDFGAQDLQASLRHDRDSQFGGATTGSLAWGIDFAPGWRFSASHGTAFKAPSFNELYYPGFSNPLLRPERSRSSELSLARSGERWRVQANVYDTRIRGLIAWDASLFKPGNVDAARIHGLELTADGHLGAWSVHGQIGWLDARNASGGGTHGLRLARRPRHSARIDLDRAFGAWSVGASAIGEGARWDDVANTLRVGGYGTLDARVGWRFAPGWTLQGNLGNVFDKRYETSAWYNQPGREFTLSLRWQPE